MAEAVAIVVGVGDAAGVAGADTGGLLMGAGVPWLHPASTSAIARSAVGTAETRGLDGRYIKASGRLTIALQATSATFGALHRPPDGTCPMG